MKAIGELLIVAIVVGGLLYLFKLLPIDETVKKFATIVVLLIAAVWVIRFLMGML